MPTPTYTPIASTTLSSTQASVVFSNLNTTAAGMRDLILVVDALLADGTANVYTNYRFNADTGANYNNVIMGGDGSTAASTSAASVTSIYGTGSIRTRNTSRFQSTLQVFDFATTDKHKSTLTRSDDAGQRTEALAGRWANTAAITSLTVFVSASNFAAGSVFSIYGVL